jgi:hypothetical protein
MLSRRSDKRLWLAQVYGKWWLQRGCALGVVDSSLQQFLDQRHAVASGWNRASRNPWESRFNDFYLFAMTERITG